MQALTAYLLLSLLRGALLFALLKLLDAILPIRLRLAWQKRSAYVFLLLLMLTPWCRFTFLVSSPMQAPRPSGETDAPIPPPLPQFMPRKPGKQLRISDAPGISQRRHPARRLSLPFPAIPPVPVRPIRYRRLTY